MVKCRIEVSERAVKAGPRLDHVFEGATGVRTRCQDAARDCVLLGPRPAHPDNPPSSDQGVGKPLPEPDPPERKASGREPLAALGNDLDRGESDARRTD